MKINRVIKSSGFVILLELILAVLAGFVAYWKSTNNCDRDSGGPIHPMKAIRYCQCGSPDVVKLASVEKPVPTDNQLLIRVRAASLNAFDVYVIRDSNVAVKVFDTDVSQNAIAEAAVSTTNEQPFVEQVHITVRPKRLKLIMKLEKYELTARYQIGPEGKPLLMDQIFDMLGSGMGQEGRAHTVTAYSDCRVASKQR